ncbi:MAG TPA: DUF2892 domain-containing protein [Mariprofundaceae bacterium]|nr:DUF2892 domain-containing protein [Mariprofundaceae bacterium]
MCKNVGSLDAVLRIIVGMALIMMALSHVFTPWTWIGVVPLATALLGYCPLYSVIGMNTAEKA